MNKKWRIFTSLLMITFWSWWTWGPRVGNDYPFVSDQTLKELFDIPRTWTERGSVGLGEYTIFTLWSYPINLLAGVLAKFFGIDFVMQERMFFLIFFIAAGIWGIKNLSRIFLIGKWGQMGATFLYLANTYILLVIDGGQLSVAFAYSWLSVCLSAAIWATNKGLRAKLLAGLSVWILGAFDIRFVFIFGLITFIYFLFNMVSEKVDFKNKISSFATTTLIIFITFCLLNAFWIIPQIKYPLDQTAYALLTETNFDVFGNLGHSLLLLSPHWPRNVFGKITPLRFEFILIPILVFLAPILEKKKKQIKFWLLLAILGIFLSKGSAEPLPKIYQWLYSYIPGFSLFRDSSKFFFLTCLSYALLFGITVDHLARRSKLLALSILIYCFVLLSPVWLGQMNGTLNKPRLENEFLQVSELIKRNPSFARIFWIPSTAPLSYSSPNHPILEASRIYRLRPFALGVKGTYEKFNFLREASFTGELLDISGVSSIVYPPLDARRDELSKDNINYYKTFLNQLLTLPWVKGLDPDSKIPIIETKKHQDRFFVADNTWVVIGSDNIYQESTKSALRHLSENAFIFADEHPGLSKKLITFPQVKILLNQKDDVDLLISLMSQERLLFPAQKLKKEPDYLGWWMRKGTDLTPLRSFLQDKYGIDNQDFDMGGGWSIAEGKRSLLIQSDKIKAGGFLFARMIESSKSGEVRFRQSGEIIGQVKTFNLESRVRWFKVGELINDTNLEIQTNGDINILNALAVLSAQELEDLSKQVKTLQDQNKIVDFNDDNIARSSNVKINYLMVSPTKYTIDISNLKQPVTLVFSSSYDSKWRLDNQEALPIYSLLNGFLIERNGRYTLEFSPQEDVKIGLIISGVSLFIILTLLITPILKKGIICLNVGSITTIV